MKNSRSHPYLATLLGIALKKELFLTYPSTKPNPEGVLNIDGPDLKRLLFC
jgi:hypothetical protein